MWRVSFPLIPAQAGIQDGKNSSIIAWVPAFAGTSGA
jgi:hypothetical protein